MAATVTTFTASGSDPSGGSLTYDWQFGDGQTASGQTVTHVFGSEGTFNAILTVRSSRGTSTTVNQSVTSRSITGSWVDGDPDFELELIQNGPNFGGKVFVQGKYVSDIQNGVLSNPRDIRFFRRWNGRGVYGVYSGQYEGTVDASLDKINVASGSASSFSLTRK
jgi:PKD repeat protein